MYISIRDYDPCLYCDRVIPYSWYPGLHCTTQLRILRMVAFRLHAARNRTALQVSRPRQECLDTSDLGCFKLALANASYVILPWHFRSTFSQRRNEELCSTQHLLRIPVAEDYA